MKIYILDIHWEDGRSSLLEFYNKTFEGAKQALEKFRQEDFLGKDFGPPSEWVKTKGNKYYWTTTLDRHTGGSMKLEAVIYTAELGD